VNVAERGLALALVTAARRMSELGLAHGKSGNLSARTPSGFLVTPSGKAYASMAPGDMVSVDGDGEAHGAHKPSSEWRIHRDIYARHAEAAAVVHTHSFYATTLACLRRPIPAFHYEVAFAGGSDIRCSEYATFGTQELSDRALEALQGRKACLLANHGVVALARAWTRPSASPRRSRPSPGSTGRPSRSGNLRSSTRPKWLASPRSFRPTANNRGQTSVSARWKPRSVPGFLIWGKARGAGLFAIIDVST
jgi:Ribulose-5-phosphate 4-epimerase and related epimerases and aldolases